MPKKVRRTKPDHEINDRIKELSVKIQENSLTRIEEVEFKRLKSLMASRIHRDKKAYEKFMNEEKLNQSDRNEAMIKSLHEQIASLKE